MAGSLKELRRLMRDLAAYVILTDDAHQVRKLSSSKKIVVKLLA